METHLLEYFTAVAAERNLTRAARRLHVAQSSVSVGLRTLERQLGTVLFERSPRAVRLTGAGEALLPEALEILDGVERLRLLGAETASGVRGTLRVGIFAGMEVLHDLPGILHRFRADFPGVEVHLRASPQGSSGFLEDLAAGRLDAAFFGLPIPNDLSATVLSEAPFVALLPRTHPLAGAADVSLTELLADDWIDVLPGFGNRVQLERAMAERGLSRRVIAEVGTLPAVPAYVAAGLGVAVVPRVIDTTGCAVVPLRDEIPHWRVSIATRRGAERRPIVGAYLAAVRGRSQAAPAAAGPHSTAEPA